MSFRHHLWKLTGRLWLKITWCWQVVWNTRQQSPSWSSLWTYRDDGDLCFFSPQLLWDHRHPESASHCWYGTQWAYPEGWPGWVDLSRWLHRTSHHLDAYIIPTTTFITYRTATRYKYILLIADKFKRIRCSYSTHYLIKYRYMYLV